MSISIHYSGKLRDAADIPAFVDEVIDLCHSLKWNHQYFSPAPDVPIEGVIIFIEGCDPIVLTFLPGGGLCHPVFYTYMRKMHDQASIEASIQYCVVHTQQAGPEAHMELIRILRYLSEKYFEEFTLNDDTKYWETNDQQQCRRFFTEIENDDGLYSEEAVHYPVDFRTSSSRLKKKLKRKS